MQGGEINFHMLYRCFLCCQEWMKTTGSRHFAQSYWNSSIAHVITVSARNTLSGRKNKLLHWYKLTTDTQIEHVTSWPWWFWDGDELWKLRVTQYLIAFHHRGAPSAGSQRSNSGQRPWTLEPVTWKPKMKDCFPAATQSLKVYTVEIIHILTR